MTSDEKTAQLNRIRWAVRGVLLLGMAASVVANVLHAVDNPISQSIAAWPPLALLLTVELISRVPVHRRALAVVRWLSTAVIAGIAAYVSYFHMVGVAARYGEQGPSPYLIPVSVDGLIVVASICLVELSGRIRSVAATAELTHQAAPEMAEVEPLTEDAPIVIAAPEPASEPADLGTPVSDEPAGQKVRQDARSNQEIEDAVRAIWQARPDFSQRKIAGLAGTSPTTARRIIREAKAAAAAQAETRDPELVEAL